MEGGAGPLKTSNLDWLKAGFWASYSLWRKEGKGHPAWRLSTLPQLLADVKAGQSWSTALKSQKHFQRQADPAPQERPALETQAECTIRDASQGRIQTTGQDLPRAN